MHRFIENVQRHRYAVATVLAVGVLSMASAAGATDDAVTSGFTTIGAQIVGYLGDAVVVVLSVMGLALGIRLLVKWVKVAVRST